MIMKKVNFRALLVLMLAVVGLTFAACQSEDSNVSTSGKLSIQLTDAPFPTDLVAQANVTINKIEIRKTNEEDGNPFVTLSEEEKSFNLLDLTNGVTASLVDLEIEAGSYDLIRLYVADASVKLSDGTEFDLKVPSGAQTGIKIFIDPSIEVAGGLTAELLLDFNVAKSFVAQGNISSPAGIKGFHFQPVIKASNLSTAGRLMGKVTDAEEVAIEGAQVSIIAADTVYTTSFTDENGAYAILGIDAGTYKVEFAKDSLQTLIEDIKVVAGNATTLDAQLLAN
ncbi:MAG: DUF4382 domain-containing protein [Marinifilaceae bacterium]